MSSIFDWSVTAGSNSNSDSAINWVEGQLPGTVNGSARAIMGRAAEIVKDLGGALTAGGTANALTITANSAFTTNVNGRFLAFRAATDNSAAATLNVNGIGAKSIRKMTTSGDAALSGAEIQADGIYLVNYSEALNGAAGGWLLVNPTIDLSSFITLTGVATLTNKTLTSPAINTPTITGGSGSGLTLTTTTLTSPTVTGLDASTTARGLIEQATDAETQTGTDTARAISAANLTAKEATAAQYLANTADRILTTDQVWSAADTVALTDAATIAVDFSTIINGGVLSLGGNRTLGNPTNAKPGQSGFLFFIQDGTGSRTLAYSSNWKFAGGVDPVLSTPAGSIDILFYSVINSTLIVANLIKAVA